MKLRAALRSHNVTTRKQATDKCRIHRDFATKYETLIAVMKFLNRDQHRLVWPQGSFIQIATFGNSSLHGNIQSARPACIQLVLLTIVNLLRDFIWELEHLAAGQGAICWRCGPGQWVLNTGPGSCHRPSHRTYNKLNFTKSTDCQSFFSTNTLTHNSPLAPHIEWKPAEMWCKMDTWTLGLRSHLARIPRVHTPHLDIIMTTVWQ